MKPIVKYVNFLPGRIVGMTLFPFILIAVKEKNNECLLEHEQYHWNEILKWGKYSFGLGIMFWYLVYVYLWLTKYRKVESWKHPMERDAYFVQEVCEAKKMLKNL